MTEEPQHRLAAAPREQASVTPLELFFDLVFVLAVTQCTALMANTPTWFGVAKGMLILGLLWWSWVGYAWLTSVVDPEEGFVRIAMFAAMASVLVAALCIPHAFDNLGIEFALAYAAFRVAHLTLYLIASQDDEGLHKAVSNLMIGSGIGIALLVVGAFFHGDGRFFIWLAALVIDGVGPYLFDGSGWKILPEHFAERHGLIVLIALGESIAAVGVGAGSHVTAGVIVGAVMAVALAATMWWAYFDVVYLVATRRLSATKEGMERNSMARDSYAYIHFPMVAGIILLSLGVKFTLAHIHSHLSGSQAFALVGGLAIYLLAHVAFRLRNVKTLNKQRLLVAIVLLVFLPFSTSMPSLAALAIVTAVMVTLITYEATTFSAGRDRIRHGQGMMTPS